MSAQIRGKVASIYVSWSKGRAKQRSCGTADRAVVRGMKRLVALLAGQRRWFLLDAVIDGRLSLGRLYDAHVANALDQLEHELQAVDLAPLVEDWIADYLAAGKSTRNAPIYRSQVKSLVGESFLSHELTPARVKTWIGGMNDLTSGSRRGRLMALRSFVKYLVAVGALPANPLRDVEAPKKNPPSMRYEAQEVDEAIVAATTDPAYRALFAFIHATGADVSPALEHTLRSDFDLERGVVRLRGTKHAKRQVHEAIIEPWALPALREYLSLMLPTVRPWAHIDRYAAAKAHKAIAETVDATGYTMRQARHSVAVRARKAGRSFEWIAGQLGNSVFQVATVYGRFTPTLEERLREVDTTERTTDAKGSANGARARTL